MIGPSQKRALLVSSALKGLEAAISLRGTPAYALWIVGVARRFLWQTGMSTAAGITPDAVRQWLARQRELGASLKTCRNLLSAISILCDHLGVDPNPCLSVRLCRCPVATPVWLDAEETKRAVALADASGAGVEVRLAVATGLRMNELRLLRWSAVDLNRRTVLVEAVTAKSRRHRVIPLSALALRPMRCQWLLTVGLEHVFPVRQTWPGGWRWLDRPRSKWWWLNALKPVVRGIPKFRLRPGKSVGRGWHVLRHTFASRLGQAGVSPKKIQEWGGWSDPKMLDVYVHLAEGYDPDIDKPGPSCENGP